MPPTQRQQGDEAAKAAERQAAERAEADKAARDSAEAGGQPADASATAAAAAAASPSVVVTEGASPKYSTKPGDVTVDPRTGQAFGKVGGDGLKGAYGAELLNADGASGPVVPGVDPKAIPAEVTPGVSPDAGGDKLLAAAQAKAPSLTREFVDKMELSDEQLGQIARGEIPPPPTPGPIYTADMYMTPGGFQQTPPGVPPEDVGGNQIHRA